MIDVILFNTMKLTWNSSSFKKKIINDHNVERISYPIVEVIKFNVKKFDKIILQGV